MSSCKELGIEIFFKISLGIIIVQFPKVNSRSLLYSYSELESHLQKLMLKYISEEELYFELIPLIGDERDDISFIDRILSDEVIMDDKNIMIDNFGIRIVDIVILKLIDKEILNGIDLINRNLKISDHILTIIWRDIPKNQLISFMNRRTKTIHAIRIYCELLLYEETFLPAFKILFGDLDSFPEVVIQYIDKSFRESINQGICLSFLPDMVSFASNLPKSRSMFSLSLDIFFSALCDGFARFIKQPEMPNLDSLFVMMSQRGDLPPSFLKFVVFSGSKVCFSDHQVILYFFQVPSLFFNYTLKCEFSVLSRYWMNLFDNVIALPRSSLSQDHHISLLQHFIISLDFHPDLLKLFLAKKIHQWAVSIIVSNTNCDVFSEREAVFLSLVLILCRKNEIIARTFSSSIDSSTYFHSILTNSIRYRVFVCLAVWLINPLAPFPFESYCIERTQYFHSQICPSSTFSIDILPHIVISIFEYNIENHLSSLVIESTKILDNCIIIDECFEKLVLCITDAGSTPVIGSMILHSIVSEELLLKIVPFSFHCHVLFEFMKQILSISCIFSVFDQVFTHLSHDIPSTIDFLHYITKKSFIVNDYLHIDSPLPIQSQIMNGSICLWVRFVDFSTPLMTFSWDNHNMVLFQDTGYLYIIIDQKCNQKISIKSGIEGWHFIHIITEKDRFNFSLDLQKVSIPVRLSTSLSLTIGGVESCFHLQSIRLFRPPISNNDANSLFSLGPNLQELLISDFLSSKENRPFYVNGNEYISNLFLEFSSLFDIKPSFGFLYQPTFELSISPPYQYAVSSRRSTLSSSERLNGSLNTIEPTPLLSKRWKFSQFCNSLEAHGGVYLIIHLLTESMMRYPDLHAKSFTFFNDLINRFPFYHYAFSQKKLYCLIGNLFWENIIDSSSLMSILFIKIQGSNLLNNSMILKHLVFGPSLYHLDYSSLLNEVLSSIHGRFSDHNRSLLRHIDAFAAIIHAVSFSSKHTQIFTSILINLAISITDANNVVDHSLLVFRHIMVNHLKFSRASETGMEMDMNYKSTDHRSFYKRKTNKSTAALIKTLKGILDIRPTNQLPLELMLSDILTCSKTVLISLIELLINYLDPSYYFLLIYLVSKVTKTKELSMFLYAYAKGIVDLKCLHSFHQILLPIVYLSNGTNDLEYLYAICTMSIGILNSLLHIPKYLYDVLLLLLVCIETREITFDNTISLILPQVISQNPNQKDFSITMTPFSLFYSQCLFRAIEVGDLDNVEKFFIAISVIHTIPEHRLGAVTMFFAGKIIEKLLQNNNEVSSKNKNRFVLFSLMYGSYVFKRMHLIPGEKNELVSMIFEYFLKQVLFFIESSNTSEILNRTIDILVQYSSHNSRNSSIVQAIQQNSVLTKNKRFVEIIDRLENPTSYTPIKTTRQRFEDQIPALESQMEAQPRILEKALLTISCNSIGFQVVHSANTRMNPFSIDDIIETWKDVFTNLLFPGSTVYKDLPIKYRILDNTTHHQQRKMLFPINPSYDRLYLSFWNTKYRTDPPSIRLQLRQVLQNTPMPLFNENSVVFNGDGVRLFGISMYKGVIVLSTMAFKFYQKPKSSSSIDELLQFEYSAIKNVRLTQFQHQRRGFILEDISNNVYIFALETANLREQFVAHLSSLGINIVHGINQKELQISTEMWCSNKLSTFEYLLTLNFVSGRNWVDFTQFPIFPWIIIDYGSNKFDYGNNQQYRNLSFPMFAQSEKQKQCCLDYYQATLEMASDPYHFPNYVSNVGSALYYLVRLEPFTDEEINFQSGSLDSADRTFQSFTITTELMTAPGSKSALELVPEVYYLPEMYENANSIVFPQSPIYPRDISHVSLPVWAKNSPYKFVQKHRKALESKVVSGMINEWIDMIWGNRREGELAKERFNVLQKIIFSFDPKQYQNDRLMLKAVTDQIHNCGQAPLQLFTSPHPKRDEITTHYNQKLVFIETRPFTNDDYLQYDNRSEQWVRSLSGFKARVYCDTIEIKKSKNHGFQYRFSDEICPVCISVDGNDVVSAHRIPLIIHWVLSGSRLKRVFIYRCHQSTITSIALLNSSRIIACGSSDGSVTTFSTNPHVFLRHFKSNHSSTISKIIITPSNSDITLIQDIGKGSTISMWSVNGAFLSELSFETKIIDITVSSFPEGTRKNFIYVLTEDGRLIVLSIPSLHIKETSTLGDCLGSSISLWKNKILFVFRTNNTLMMWQI